MAQSAVLDAWFFPSVGDARRQQAAQGLYRISGDTGNTAAVAHLVKGDHLWKNVETQKGDIKMTRDPVRDMYKHRQTTKMMNRATKQMDQATDWMKRSSGSSSQGCLIPLAVLAVVLLLGVVVSVALVA